MKITVTAALLLIIVFILPFRWCGEKVPEIDIPDSVGQSFGDTADIENTDYSELISFEKAAEAVSDIIKNTLSERKASFGLLIAVLAVLYILKTLSDSYTDSGALRTLGTLVSVICAAAVFEELFSAGSGLSETCTELSAFVLSLSPVMFGAVASAGFTGTAVTASASVFTVTQVFSWIITSVVVPFTYAHVAVGIGAGLSGTAGLRMLSAKIRNLCVIIISFVFCILSGIMSLQTVIAMSADSVAKRAVKAAAGTFIPVFGGSVGEGLETVFASATVLKNNCGAVGVAVIFTVIAAPVIKISMSWILLSLSELLCGMFGNEAVGGFVSVIKDCCVILFASAVAYGLLLMVEISLIVIVVS